MKIVSLITAHVTLYVRKCRNLGFDNCFMNVTQSVERSPAVQHIPAVTQNRTVFSQALQRTLAPAELLCCQGWPVFADEQMPYSCPWKRHVVRTEVQEDGSIHYMLAADQPFRSLAGNGMSMPCIGNILMFVLACTSVKHGEGGSPTPSSEPETASLDMDFWGQERELPD